ncbi:hypothetical protein FRX31_018048 [Thalictrum thalictroides]|uniref:Uncharacterized protein n=1 Tax=Thalictrum thalictroides TaxID=46969 RepID=A0A7J6W7P4_THATH|nr:hypothetical protein FRX31_018048 [Thalictrum thalictroides]
MQQGLAAMQHKKAAADFSLALATGKFLTISLTMHNRSDNIGRLRTQGLGLSHESHHIARMSVLQVSGFHAA